MGKKGVKRAGIRRVGKSRRKERGERRRNRVD